MGAEIIDGKAFAARVRADVAGHVARLKSDRGITPGLAVVLVGTDPASEVYVRNKGIQTREAGMQSFEHKLSETASQDELMALIAQDEMFHLDEAALEASLEPSKYVGCSAHQVERFLNDVIRPVLKENEADLGMKAEINV